MTYQRKVVRQLRDLNLGELFAEQWIAFSDENGKGMAQPDAFILLPGQILLFECKLTQKEGAEKQVRELYQPLLEHIYGLPVVCCQVFKNIRWLGPNMVEGAEDLVGRKGYWLWHNLR